MYQRFFYVYKYKCGGRQEPLITYCCQVPWVQGRLSKLPFMPAAWCSNCIELRVGGFVTEKRCKRLTILRLCITSRRILLLCFFFHLYVGPMATVLHILLETELWYFCLFVNRYDVIFSVEVGFWPKYKTNTPTQM